METLSQAEPAYGGAVIPLRFIFRSRWAALAWAIGMIATAVSVADQFGSHALKARTAGPAVENVSTPPAAPVRAQPPHLRPVM